MRAFTLFATFLLIFSIFSQVAVAQEVIPFPEFKGDISPLIPKSIPRVTLDPSGEWEKAIASALAVPQTWLRLPELVFLLLLPLAAIILILVAFMRTLHIFEYQTKIQVAIGIIIALLTLPTNIFFIIVSVVFSGLGFFAVGAFVLLFILGIVFYTRGRFHRWNFNLTRRREFGETHIFQIQKIRRELENLDERAEDIHGEMADADGAKYDRLQKELDKILERQARLAAQLRRLQRSRPF